MPRRRGRGDSQRKYNELFFSAILLLLLRLALNFKSTLQKTDFEKTLCRSEYFAILTHIFVVQSYASKERDPNEKARIMFSSYRPVCF